MVPTRAAKRRTSTIRLNADGTEWHFGSTVRGTTGYLDQVVAHLDDIEPHTASELQTVMRSAVRAGSVDPELLVSSVERQYFDDEDSPVGPISFGVADSQLTLRFTFDMNRWIEDGDHTEQSRLAGALEPFLRRNRMSLRSFEPDYNYQGPPWLWRGEIALKPRGKSLSWLYEIGCQAIALLNAFESGQLSRESTGDLIRAGHAELLLGQAESHWLDVKSQH